MILRLKDAPKIAQHQFQPGDHCLRKGVSAPCHRDVTTGLIAGDDDYLLCGVCRNPPERLMFGREGQLLLMLFSDETGEVWQHYPIFDSDEFAPAKMDVRGIV